jgi:threonyl-tRNA synthetase
LGDNEVKNETVSVRLYNQKKQFILKLDELISYIEKM